MSNYVILRYPYVSLIKITDKDPFTEHYPIENSGLYIGLKLMLMVFSLSFALMIAATGVDSVEWLFVFLYCALLAVFMGYYLIWFDSFRHPTVVTFVRSTMGFGIPLFPFFAMTILIGVCRCHLLLNSVTTIEQICKRRI